MAQQLIKLFGKDAEKNLFPDNAFYKQSKLDANPGMKARTVQVPQIGASKAIITNPSSFPLTPAQTVDDVLEYNLDYFATTPQHITDLEEMETNYSKRSNYLEDHTNVINQRVAESIGYAWAGSANITKLATTGASRESSYGGAAKKAVTLADIIKIAKQFDLDNVPMKDRFLLINPWMQEDLMGINEFISFDYNNTKPLVNGTIGRIYGFEVFVRSEGVVFDNTDSLITVGDAPATTDRSAILAWQKSMVRRSEGSPKVFMEMNKPEYLGDVFNLAVKAGGSFGRNDSKGVVALIQAENV